MPSRKIKQNPFYQPPRQWQIHVYAHRDTVSAAEEAFSDIASSISSFELVEDQPEWRVDIIVDSDPVSLDIDARLALVSGMQQGETPRYEHGVLEQKNWLQEVERGFAPLHIGRFYVHGSHAKPGIPVGKIPLEINAGLAFGSGEHATTSGCLLALQLLAKRRRFRKPLDMGCGSGILALAMAKLWHVPVMGADIDPVSISVAAENAKKNRVEEWTRFHCADGYNAQFVKQHAPYDIITANILARPLMTMAPQLAKHLAPGGFAVLSGLLVTQEARVLSAHISQGLRLSSRIRKNGWSTLILST